MAAEKGRDLVLKVGDGATDESFTVIGGMKANAITINNESVDVTDKDSAGKRELLAQAGIQSMSMSGSGVFKGTAGETTLRVNAQEDTINNYELVFASGDKYSGAFQITSFETSGDDNNARLFTVTLESSGSIDYA